MEEQTSVEPTPEKALRTKATTHPHILFAREYFTSHNASAAYAKVYKVERNDTSATNGGKLLMISEVLQELARLGEIANNRGILTREKVEREIARLAFSNISDLAGQGIESVDDLEGLPEDTTAAIKKVKRTQRFDKEGGIMSETVEIEAYDKNAPLALAANILGMTKNQEALGVTVIFNDDTELHAVIDVSPAMDDDLNS